MTTAKTDKTRAGEIVRAHTGNGNHLSIEWGRKRSAALTAAIAAALSAARREERSRAELIALRYRDHADDISSRGAADHIASAIRSPHEGSG
jgi:hypothetical protein